MERKIAFVLILSVGIACGLGVGVLFAQPVEPSNLAIARVDAGPAVKVRDWYDAADIVLRVVTIVVLSGGLLGTFAVITSLRASAYSQIYSRFQGVLLKLAEHPHLFERMKRDEYIVSHRSR